MKTFSTSDVCFLCFFWIYPETGAFVLVTEGSGFMNGDFGYRICPMVFGFAKAVYAFFFLFMNFLLRNFLTGSSYTFSRM